MPEKIVHAQEMRQLILKDRKDAPVKNHEASGLPEKPSEGGGTQFSIQRHRSGSITNYHAHNTIYGAITHTDRYGETSRMNAGSHDSETKYMTNLAHRGKTGPRDMYD